MTTPARAEDTPSDYRQAETTSTRAACHTWADLLVNNFLGSRFGKIITPDENFEKRSNINDITKHILLYKKKRLDYKISETLEIEIRKLTKHMQLSCEDDLSYACIIKYIPNYLKYNEADLVIGDEKVFITSVHKAKGLEFENVIIMGCTDNNYPSYYSSFGGEESIYEEARLLYVALTRAKESILITDHSIDVIPTVRGPWHKSAIPSRFLYPILNKFEKTIYGCQNIT